MRFGATLVDLHVLGVLIAVAKDAGRQGGASVGSWMGKGEWIGERAGS